MKAGDRKKFGRYWYIWVICPEPGCGKGRWAQESRTKMPNFTGRCKKCYKGIAKREMAQYYTTHLKNEERRY